MESVRSELSWASLNYMAPWEVRRPSPIIKRNRYGARSEIHMKPLEQRTKMKTPPQKLSVSVQCEPLYPG